MKKILLLLLLLPFLSILADESIPIAPYVDADDCNNIPVWSCIEDSCCINPPLCCYINFFGAPNWANISGFDGHVTTKLGFLAGAGLGFQLGCYSRLLTYTRLEVEYSIRKNQLNQYKNDIVDEELYGSAATNCWMVDLYQDFPICRYTIPFVGVGAGYSYRNTLKELAVYSGIQDKSDGFAWQVVAGLTTPVNIATFLSVEYRYFTSPKYLRQQSVGLSLRYLY